MILFVTNREILNPGTDHEEVRVDGLENAGSDLRFGEYIYTGNILEGRFSLFPDPVKEEELLYTGLGSTRPEELKGSARFFKLLYDCMVNSDEDKNDVLLFIHGFNSNLDTVRENITALHKRYVEPEDSPVGHIVVFTWPGRTHNLPLHYRDDRDDAIRSGIALGRGILKTVQFLSKFLGRDENKPCDRKVHLLLHSMGHRVFKHAMLELNKERIPKLQLFEEIICMAGDVDYDIFEKEYAFYSLIDMGSRVHIYYHKKDRVLDISKYTKNFTNRLGKYGRRYIEDKMLDVFDYDVTATKDDDSYGFREEALNHWYYYTSTEVVTDVIGVMNGKASVFTGNYKNQ